MNATEFCDLPVCWCFFPQNKNCVIVGIWEVDYAVLDMKANNREGMIGRVQLYRLIMDLVVDVSQIGRKD